MVSSVPFGKAVTLKDPRSADTRLRIEAGFSCSCLTGKPYPFPLSRTLIQKCSLARSIATSILEAPPCRAAFATASASMKESSVASALRYCSVLRHNRKSGGTIPVSARVFHDLLQFIAVSDV